jgi:hypothetical protein
MPMGGRRQRGAGTGVGRKEVGHVNDFAGLAPAGTWIASG